MPINESLFELELLCDFILKIELAEYNQYCSQDSDCLLRTCLLYKSQIDPPIHYNPFEYAGFGYGQCGKHLFVKFCF